MQDLTPDQFINEVKTGKNDYFGLSAFEYCNINFDNQAKRDMAKQLQECYSWGGGDCNKVIDTLEYIAPDCEYCAKHSQNNNSASYDLASAKHVNTRIIKLQGEQLAIAIDNNQDY